MLISRINSNNSFGNILAQETENERVTKVDVNVNANANLGSEKLQIANSAPNKDDADDPSQTTEIVQPTSAESNDSQGNENTLLVM